MGRVFGRRPVHPSCRVGARVRNTVPGDFAADGRVIETSGTHDVKVWWDDEATPEPGDRGWWTLDVNVEPLD